MRFLSILCAIFIFTGCGERVLPKVDSSTALPMTTWYWLNSAPETQWNSDFKQIRALGIHKVVLWYGWQPTLIVDASAATRRALDMCARLGLQVSLGIWSGTHMGKFDLKSNLWKTKWFEPYLQKIAKLYGNHPAVSGYYLDEALTFGAGAERQYLGRSDKGYVMGWLSAIKRLLNTEARKQHLVICEAEEAIELKLADLGLSWKELRFLVSRVMLYNPTLRGENRVRTRVQELRQKMGERLPLVWGVFTFTIGEDRRSPGLHPTAAQLEWQLREAKLAGAAAIDLFAYRVGDWTVPASQVRDLKLGPEHPGALLRYRPDLQQSIRRHLRS